MMRHWQLAPQICNTEPVGMPMDSFAGKMHHSNLSQTCHHMLQLYNPKTTKQ